MKSLHLETFVRMVRELENGDGDEESEAFIRNVMTSVMYACPRELLIKLCYQLADHHEKEWIDYTEQN